MINSISVTFGTVFSIAFSIVFSIAFIRITINNAAFIEVFVAFDRITISDTLIGYISSIVISDILIEYVSSIVIRYEIGRL